MQLSAKDDGPAAARAESVKMISDEEVEDLSFIPEHRMWWNIDDPRGLLDTPRTLLMMPREVVDASKAGTAGMASLCNSGRICSHNGQQQQADSSDDVLYEPKLLN